MNKLSTCIVSLSFFFSLSCIYSYSQIPSSNRSKKVITRQTPLLKDQFQKKGLELGSRIFIRIFKEEKQLEVWVMQNYSFRLFKSYPICTFSGNPGTKKARGDNQAPEGFYSVYPNQLNPSSSFHLSFNIGYPNAYDRAHKYTGSHIMVHGNCVSIGCYAMTDPLIEEIFTIAVKAFEGKQPFIAVHIFPFKMNDDALKKHAMPPWIAFWENLRDGYDYFEKNKVPPVVSVRNKKYVFNQPAP